jgi:hypothetical protein
VSESVLECSRENGAVDYLPPTVFEKVILISHGYLDYKGEVEGLLSLLRQNLGKRSGGLSTSRSSLE